MNKLLLILSIVLFFSCESEKLNLCYDTKCFENEYCLDGKCIKVEDTNTLSFKDIPTPTKITISNLVITKYNEIKFGDVPYDMGSRPDLYIVATMGSQKVYDFTTINDANVAPVNIPLQTPFEITTFNNPLVFNLYDDDGNLTDEFMGGILFNIFDVNNAYPEQFNVENTAVGFKFDAAYEF